jgi:hypothetical protein
MILFPDIKTLFTVYLYGNIRAHGCANRTSIAFLGFIHTNGMVALHVELFGWRNMTLGAEMNTEMTFLAQFFFDFNISFHTLSPNS